jgi:hypothetical protein
MGDCEPAAVGTEVPSPPGTGEPAAVVAAAALMAAAFSGDTFRICCLIDAHGLGSFACVAFEAMMCTACNAPRVF